MTRHYFEDAHGAFIVFDSSSEVEKSLKIAEDWKTVLDESFRDNPIPSILLANKCDKLPPDFKDVQYKRFDEFCDTNKIDKWFLTSALEGTGLNEAVEELVNLIFSTNQSLIPKEKEGFKLTPIARNQPSSTPEKKTTCC
eukprot:gene15421-18289_t